MLKQTHSHTGLGSVSFDTEEIDAAIADSGLAAEFGLGHATMRHLAAVGLILCSMCVTARSDEEFEALLGNVEPAESEIEKGFLFGFAEHVRQDVVRALESVEDGLQIRPLLHRRLARARELCVV